MKKMLKLFVTGAFLYATLLCQQAFASQEERKLNIYNWSDYITADTIKQFESETGIKVQYDVYDSNQILESKLMAGKTGYDIVAPTASPYLARQIKLGLYQVLDRSKLTNYGNLDHDIMKMLSKSDHDNLHSIPWMWGTIGIGYNVKKAAQYAPNIPLNSLNTIFDINTVKKFSSCGVGMLDSAGDIIPVALTYLGLNPNSQKKEDLRKAQDLLISIRPYIREIHSSKYIDSLANGDLCLVLGYSGDVMQASKRAKEAKKGVEIKYVLAKEGVQLWIDAFAIPKDAPHPNNALAFLNFILRANIVARNTNALGYANPNKAAFPLVDKSISGNKSIYPSTEERNKMYILEQSSLEFDRLRTRTWTRFVSGR